MSPKKTTEIDVAIGAKIKTYRKAFGMSQSTLGEILGVSFQQVQKYEKSFNRVPGGRLARIASTFGVTVADLTDVAAAAPDPEAIELVAAFSSIADPKTRAAALDLVKAIAGIEGGK